MTKIRMGARHYLYPQPAILAGVNIDGKPNYLAIAWCGIMQATPPLIYVSIRKERFSFQGFEQSESFSVNVPSTSNASAVDWCGLNSGHNVDKSGVFKNFYGNLGNAPMIDEFPINMECKLVKSIDFGGTHVVFVGEIVECFVSDEFLTDGSPDVKKIDPLVFTTDGKYFGIGEFVGNAYDIGNGFDPENRRSNP